MKWRYTTIQGDTWDTIALKVYNSEMLAGLILRENAHLAHVVFFGAGEHLIIPDLPEAALETAQPAPPWKRGQA